MPTSENHGVTACDVFTFPVDGDPDAFFARAEALLTDAGGEVDGDAAEGRVALDIPALGAFRGHYRIDGNGFRLQIVAKPWIVPCGLIEQAVAARLAAPDANADTAPPPPDEGADPGGVGHILRSAEYFDEFIVARTPARQRGRGGSRLLDVLNYLARLGRDRRYRRRLREHPGAAEIVSEGDSWFNFPLLGGDDLIDYLVRDERFAVRSLGGAGDSLSRMSRGERSEVVRVLRELNGRARAVLLSGGGVDLLFSGFELLFVDAGDALFDDPADYLARRGGTTRFAQRLERVEASFRSLIWAIRTVQRGVPIAIHGYDYPLPRESQHIGRTLTARRIPEAAWNDLLRYMLDRFNDLLTKLEHDYDDVTHIDLRGRLPVQEDWYDEIHAARDSLRTAVAPHFMERVAQLL